MQGRFGFFSGFEGGEEVFGGFGAVGFAKRRVDQIVHEVFGVGFAGLAGLLQGAIEA